jgi:hypothetical protein
MRRRRSILALAVALALLAACSAQARGPAGGSPGSADDEFGRPPAAGLQMIRDLRLSVLAQREMKNDRVLKYLNLSVKVRNGVAEVSGKVQSEEIARYALGKVETVKGIVEARPRFQWMDGTMLVFGAPPPSDHATIFQAAKPPARLAPGATTGSETLKAHSEPPRELPAVDVSPVPTSDPPPRDDPPAVVVGTPHRVAAPATSLADRVAEVRQSQTRFKLIPVDVKDDGTLIVHRAGVSSLDATALSQALRRIPGVSEVLLSSD